MSSTGPVTYMAEASHLAACSYFQFTVTNPTIHIYILPKCGVCLKSWIKRYCSWQRKLGFNSGWETGYLF